jgi:hypothetical protein
MLEFQVFDGQPVVDDFLERVDPDEQVQCSEILRHVPVRLDLKYLAV